MSERQAIRTPALGAEEAALMTALPASGAGAAALGQIMRDVRAMEAQRIGQIVPVSGTTPAAQTPVVTLYGRGGRAALHQVMWRT